MAEVSAADLMAIFAKDRKAEELMTELSGSLADIVSLLEAGTEKHAKALTDALLPALRELLMKVQPPPMAAPQITVQQPSWKSMDAEVKYAANGKVERLVFTRK
jgi:hypothetical protein